MALTGITGMILLVSAVLYHPVVPTLIGRTRDLEHAPEIPFSEARFKARPTRFQRLTDETLLESHFLRSGSDAEGAK